MTHEMLYTSAPRGLRPSSSGYCVVAQTDGIPRALVEQLEALSTYRHISVGEDPRTTGNPVAHVYAITSAGGRTYHVLSRIADAGLDHTGRSNYLAHHVALTAEELPRSGPAAVCEHWPFQDSWDGTVGELPASRVPDVPVEAQVCARWEAETGDAGWGGVLAGATNPSEPAYIVFRPGQDVLPLIAEALALLPSAERWNVTFSTYFTKGGSECQWRCVVAGSAEARAALAARRGVVIRLDRDTSGEPPAGRLVSAARTGVVPQSRARVERSEPTAPRERLALDMPPAYEEVESTEAAPVEAAEPLEPRPRPRAATPPRQAPVPVSGGGMGQLLLGLVMGLILMFVMVALIEVVAKATILGVAKMKSQAEEEQEKVAKEATDKLKEATEKLKEQTQRADDNASQLGDAKRRLEAVPKQKSEDGSLKQKEETWKRELAKADQEKIAAENALKEYMRLNPPQPANAEVWISQLFMFWKDDVDMLKSKNDELNMQNATLRKQIEDAKKDAPLAAAHGSQGVPIELKDQKPEELRTLFVASSDAKSIRVFGLPDTWKIAPGGDGSKVVVTDDKGQGFRAELSLNHGIVTISGEKLENHQFFAAGIIAVKASSGSEVYYHLVADWPRSDLSTAPIKMSQKMKGREKEVGAFHGTVEIFKPIGEYIDALTKDQFKLRTSARIMVNGKEYVLEGKDNVLTSVPNGNGPRIMLTLKKGAQHLDLDIMDAKMAGPPTCQIVILDVVREVKDKEKPVRQELIRIRAPLKASNS